MNSDGKRNMPSGEVFTGPLESSANGRIRFGVPSSPSGVDVAGVDLEFRDGLVVAAYAERGDAYLQRALATDEGARRLGEVGIGTNFGIDRPIGATLFDEKIGGTVHLAWAARTRRRRGRTSQRCTGSHPASARRWALTADGERCSTTGASRSQAARLARLRSAVLSVIIRGIQPRACSACAVEGPPSASSLRR